MNFFHLVCKIAGQEREEQNQECPSLENPNDDSPAGNVVGEDHYHVGEDPDKWKFSSCYIMFSLLPGDHVWGRFRICSPLIPLDEERSAGPIRERQHRDNDADFLGDASKVSSATDYVDLKEKLGPCLLQTIKH